jgi:hypothetical protein
LDPRSLQRLDELDPLEVGERERPVCLGNEDPLLDEFVNALGRTPDRSASSTLSSWSTWLEHHEPQHGHQDQDVQATKPEKSTQATPNLVVLSPALLGHVLRLTSR